MKIMHSQFTANEQFCLKVNSNVKNAGFGDRRSFSDGANTLNPTFPQLNGGTLNGQGNVGRSTTPQLPNIHQSYGSKVVFASQKCVALILYYNQKVKFRATQPFHQFQMVHHPYLLLDPIPLEIQSEEELTGKQNISIST